VPEEQFEAALAGHVMPTTSGIIEALNPTPLPQGLHFGIEKPGYHEVGR
jgi:hypothetical protein